MPHSDADLTIRMDAPQHATAAIAVVGCSFAAERSVRFMAASDLKKSKLRLPAGAKTESALAVDYSRIHCGCKRHIDCS
jgi:hypothetical protein